MVIIWPSVDFRLLWAKKERIFLDLIVKRSSINVILQLLLWDIDFQTTLKVLWE